MLEKAKSPCYFDYFYYLLGCTGFQLANFDKVYLAKKNSIFNQIPNI
jgi:hypothetical protein